MKGGVGGVKVSQFSLILIGLVCVTVLVLTWTKTTTLTSLFPAQGAVPVEFLEANRSSVQVEMKEVESAASSGVEPAVEGGSSENLTTINDKDEGLPVEILEANRNPVQMETTEVDSVASSGVDDAVEGGNTGNLTTIKNKEIHPSVKGITESEEVPGEKITPRQADTHLVAPQNSSTTESSFVREQTRNLPAVPEKKDCNYAKGKWVMDDSRPLYSGFDCKQWLSPMWACRLTQRKDFEYEKLRWQPKECKMEEFTASRFLERMQDKTLAFVGDSLGRQQFQSLMCMATSGKDRPDVLDVGREFGLVLNHGAARPDGWAYRFPSTNTTILYYWSASLCDLEPIDASNATIDIAMHLDRPPAFLRRYLHKIDVLVLNTGHHWNRGKLNANRWKMYVGGAPNTNRNIATIAGAKNFTIYSTVRWVNSQLPSYPGLKAFLRSISPRHFFNGDWNTGGTCDNTTPLSGGKEILKDESSDSLAAGAVSGTGVKLLDVTGLSELRDEGHISRYSIKATPGVQDCLHWCLPGVPDTWNEVLFAQI